MKKVGLAVLFLGIFSLLSACASNNFAPVTDGWRNTNKASQTYHVQSDDTLYSIAFRYGIDYRQLAALNNISPPYHVVTGEVLQLLPGADDTLTTSSAPNGDTAPASSSVVATGGAPSTTVTSQSVTTSTSSAASTTPAASSPTQTQVQATQTPISSSAQTTMAVPKGPIKTWIWPAQGKVIHTYSDAYGGNKGIDIAGTMGQPIKATAAGRVVYCGTGLRGYGLLIIIKHNNDYLSAYAHNSKAYVKEGDVVPAGQTIAAMGNTDAPQVMLHFEIRDAGKPVDPLSYLPSKQG